LGDDFKKAAEATDECIDNVWYEFDEKDTGYITWHQVRPFLKMLNVHSDELAENHAKAVEE
jgi:hypothetical protein